MRTGHNERFAAPEISDHEHSDIVALLGSIHKDAHVIK